MLDLTRKCDYCHQTIPYGDEEAGRCCEDCCYFTNRYYCGKCLRVIRYSHTGIACETICKNCEKNKNDN